MIKIIIPITMEPICLGDLIPSIASFKKLLKNMIKGIKLGEFYEESTVRDFKYPNK